MHIIIIRNDPAAHFHDIYEYHETASAVIDYVNAHPDTVVISTSDHETGGFTLGRQLDENYPEYKWCVYIIIFFIKICYAIIYCINERLF